jgi:hypothetical protein
MEPRMLAAGRQTAAALLTCVLIGCTNAAIAQSGLASGEVALPADVAPYWAWLPADTETAIVARDVAFASPFDLAPGDREKITDEDRKRFTQEAPALLCKSTALGALQYVGGGNMVESGRYRKLLAGVTSPLVVYGGRDYEFVSVFGGSRYHGASVITFAEKDTAALDTWLAALEKNAAEVRTVGDRKVLVFPFDKKLMEPVYKVLPWQATYIVRVAPDAVVCASSDVYLGEVLARMGEAPRDRALPASLPEWKYADATANVWGLRHIPPAADQRYEGVVWMAEPSGRRTFEAYFWWGGEPDLDRLAETWLRAAHDEGATVAPSREKYLETPEAGVTKLTLPLQEMGPMLTLPMFSFNVLQSLPGKL